MLLSEHGHRRLIRGAPAEQHDAPCAMLGEIPRVVHPDGTRATGDDDIVEHAGVQRPVRDGRGIGEGSLEQRVPVYRAA
ncbi:Uncharacterised protein [Mycobacterium tuberculosis]|uniref:Uncharacterized protein n=1 Tax=Mycobacterium tuberculosis TaxID=1773 RepID=A0A654TDK0_MYCTX|nr:Uncharacterised protein [Mycobacterium tuberculosis]CFR90939.1 Uncharacterised protein [Mycobacterium tuberculosis]CKV23652.1 Uncharacterised protein [Mycobacterium tuberculosis]CNU93445.1 Uncharacterised protein [Mycobacterium tuberculosis]CNV25199.1 Uncharacterised protein [Mycobacterium tuberculosis]